MSKLDASSRSDDGGRRVAYLLARTRMDWLFNVLGRLDYVLLNKAVPVLRSVATYAIIEASK